MKEDNSQSKLTTNEQNQELHQFTKAEGDSKVTLQKEIATPAKQEP